LHQALGAERPAAMQKACWGSQEYLNGNDKIDQYMSFMGNDMFEDEDIAD
jgi:hypothetical protein